MLHPWYKSLHFHKAGGPREWITTAESLLQDEWTTSYKPKSVPADTAPVGVFVYVLQYLFDTDAKSIGIIIAKQIF